jgi:hypothetical protein
VNDAPNRRAGHVYVELIGQQLAAERAGKTSLEQRGASVVTWAGALVAAALGLLQALPADNRLAAGAVVVAALLLTASAIAATFVIEPDDYAASRLVKLREILASDAFMGADELVGLRRAGENGLDILDTDRDTNQRKAERLRLSVRLLAAGAAALALAVAAIAVPIVLG